MSHDTIIVTTEADASRRLSAAQLPLPAPKTPITIRRATMEDLPFMDGLQKKHSKALGFFSRAMFEGYITKYTTLIAEVAGSSQRSACSDANTASCKPEAVGYCVSTDRYLKRDELGAVFQLCVDESYRRGFVAAALLKEVFEQSAYGCRLYCCWCAQDLPANRFWESMGFVPLAYRAGGKARSSQPAARSDGGPLKAESCKLKATPRIHIYWQKRIRAGDVTTPYWFPSKTDGGAIREDRIILPIPLDRHWSDVLPLIEPTEPAKSEGQGATPALDDQRPQRKRKALDMTPPPSDGRVRSARQFDGPPAKAVVTNPVAPVNTTLAIEKATPAIEKAKPAIEKVKKPRPRADKHLIAAARELKDRWLEQVNAHPEAIAPAGKYDLVRAIESPKGQPPRRIAA